MVQTVLSDNKNIPRCLILSLRITIIDPIIVNISPENDFCLLLIGHFCWE